jgi:thioredoxin-related protein
MTLMKQGLVAGFVAAALLAAGLVQAGGGLPRGIRWQPDVHTGQRVSQETHKPMLLVVGANWCTWCRKLEQTTLSDARLDNYINANFVPIHLDADRDSRMVQALHAESLPTAVILSPNDDLLGRITGYKDVAGYQAALAVAAARLPESSRQSRALVHANQVPAAPAKPAPYHKVYPTYPQFHRTSSASGAGMAR